ncbi:hypothetical protein EDD16DRAFT_1498137 [Pisolithus croceorrhizus]|nr:hypothetical protein EDD16DRAFT_1498137 [Pisolithus croceorrhizus]
MDAISLNPYERETWQVPAYNITSGNTRVLLSRTRLYPDPDFQYNFARRALWRTTDDINSTEYMSIFFVKLGHLTLNHALTLCQPSPIVDFLWYPCASRHSPSTYCFIASVRECPVKLLDGNDGRLRASYPIVDHRERHIAPHSLLFNPTADKLYCGFQDAIEIFDIHRPGEGERLLTRPSKKSKEGLKGIVSSLSCSTTGTYFAAGTLTSASPVADNIALFDVSGGMRVLSVGGIWTYESGGVVQVMFSPTNEYRLYAAFRRSPCVWAWDLRDASTPVCRFEPTEVTGVGMTPDSGGWNNASNVLRYSPTNQKIHFDIERGGRWMSRGDQEGNIAIYGLHSNQQSAETTTGGMSGFGTGNAGNGPVNVIQPIQEFKAHSDAIGSATFHPLKPVLLSISGSRHFDAVASPNISFTGSEGNAYSDSDSDLNSDEGEREGAQHWQRPSGVIVRPRARPQPTVRDASIKLWDLGFENPST